MSHLEVLEAEVRKLPRDEALQLQDFLAGTNWADRRPSTNASLNLYERTTESAPNLHLLLLPAVCRKPTPTLPSSGAHLSRGDEIADDLNLVGRINPKLTWGGQVSAEVLADNRYDHSKSPVHPTGHCHGRDRYASFRDRYAEPQTAPSDQARRRRALA